MVPWRAGGTLIRSMSHREHHPLDIVLESVGIYDPAKRAKVTDTIGSLQS